MSPEARREAAKNSIEFFARYYLNHAINTELSNLHKEWCDLMTTKQNIAIAAPRGHAKSTWFTMVYPLWCILLKKKSFIIIISDTSSQAELLLGSIVENLETNELIQKDFGLIAGYIPESAREKEKWTARDIITTTGIKVIARGWGSRIRGVRHHAQRPDLIILDDVENDKNVMNEEQREQVKNIFGKSILNLGHSNTQHIVVGTILHFDSLLMRIINNPGPDWFVKLYKAIVDNKPLWPEYWTMEMFEKKIADPQIGIIKFEQEFMNNPLDPNSQIIKPTAYWEGNIDPTMFEFYAYVDLAISEKETADYFAIVTIGKERQTGKLWVVDPVRMRGDVHEQMKLLFAQNDKYHYKVVGVESVAYQKAFLQIAQAESMKQGKYVPLIEVEVDKDKVRRAIEVTPHIENGTVLFNNNYQDYMAELIQFPKASHDDYVDATVGAIKLAISNIGTSSVKSGGGNKYTGI